ncbi:cyclase/dehydrase, partial [Fennellomyces sp. T-0311]
RTFFSMPDILPSSRKEYSERQLLNYSQEQVYNVVSNVKEYQQFVPFCNFSHVYSQHDLGNNKIVFDGELGVGFKMFEEKYTSKVTCQYPAFVEAVSSDASLFKELVTTWRFTPNLPAHKLNLPDARHHPSCFVDFGIRFEFASPLHAQASSVFFEQVSKMMLQAFVDRCKTVYR